MASRFIKESRRCEVCGDGFAAQSARQKICSAACRRHLLALKEAVRAVTGAQAHILFSCMLPPRTEYSNFGDPYPIQYDSTWSRGGKTCDKALRALKDAGLVDVEVPYNDRQLTRVRLARPLMPCELEHVREKYIAWKWEHKRCPYCGDEVWFNRPCPCQTASPALDEELCYCQCCQEQRELIQLGHNDEWCRCEGDPAPCECTHCVRVRGLKKVESKELAHWIADRAARSNVGSGAKA